MKKTLDMLLHFQTRETKTDEHVDTGKLPMLKCQNSTLQTPVLCNLLSPQL